jgi:hypothetical protein
MKPKAKAKTPESSHPYTIWLLSPDEKSTTSLSQHETYAAALEVWTTTHRDKKCIISLAK